MFKLTKNYKKKFGESTVKIAFKQTFNKTTNTLSVWCEVRSIRVFYAAFLIVSVSEILDHWEDTGIPRTYVLQYLPYFLNTVQYVQCTVWEKREVLRQIYVQYVYRIYKIRNRNYQLALKILMCMTFSNCTHGKTFFSLTLNNLNVSSFANPDLFFIWILEFIIMW